jgi:23S rRNA (pseudouridine1915-N3)-methyltransferase
MQDWIDQGMPVSLIIGGADGLDESVLSAAQERWSLSDMTLPHALVRVVLAEQLYRAWTILKNHPYHRE